MKIDEDEIVYGDQIDGKTRCVHYHSDLDIVAIKMKCCDKFYACIHCHNEMEDHDAQQWKRFEFKEKVILCGNCYHELTILNYMKEVKCNHCNADFNPNCKNHYPYYFDEEF